MMVAYNDHFELHYNWFSIFQAFHSSNGSQLKNPDISGAIFTLSLSILILISPGVEGATEMSGFFN